MRSLKTFGTIYYENQLPPEEFWKKYDAGDFGRAITDFNSPAFQDWLKDVGALPAEAQVVAVVKKLQELNPRFDGKETHKVEKGVITELQFTADDVTDISPVRALTALKTLRCSGTFAGSRKLCDLSPLRGMSLKHLECAYTQLSDLSPLREMPLTLLQCAFTPVFDLSPLTETPLTYLYCTKTKVADISPLRGLPLKELQFDFKPERDTEALRTMKNLEAINEKPAAEFWKEVEEQQKGKKP